MPTTETITSSLADLRLSPIMYRLSRGDGDAKKITNVERKRVFATITLEDGYTERVRVDQPLVFEREVPTDEERDEQTNAAKVDLIRRFVEGAERSFTASVTRLADRAQTGSFNVSSFDLDNVLQTTAHANVAGRVRHAVLDAEGLSNAERVERAQELCASMVTGFWGSQSTSNASNQLTWHEMSAWGDLARDVSRGW